MPKNPHADFSPVLDGYSGIGAFRFWCQTALPLTYDDSLSYYELLNKVVNYLNHTIEDLTAVENNTSALAEAFDELEKYVNDYFDDIDIEAELRNVLDAMAEDGTLDALLDPLVENRLPGVVAEQINDAVAGQIDESVAGQIDESVAEQLPPLVDAGIPGEVSDWLDENVDPVGSAVMVDSSLTISGAAADAKVTGDKLDELKAQIDEAVDNESVWNSITLSVQTDGYYEPDGDFHPDTGRRYAIVDNVSEDETYRLCTILGPALIAAILYYNGNTFISYEKTGTGTLEIVTNYEFVIPNGCNKIIVQCARPTGDFTLEKYAEQINVFKGYTKEESDAKYTPISDYEDLESNVEIIGDKVDNIIKEKYGVRWNVNDVDDLGTRIFDAIGKTAMIGVGSTDGSSDFDEIYPWSEIKRCNIKKNETGASIITFEGETGFALDGTNGDVFVRIPKFSAKRYTAVENNTEYEYCVISTDDENVHPAFVENGKTLNEIFVGAFEAFIENGKLRSKAGVIPTNCVVANAFLDAAQENGGNYSLYDSRCVDAIWCLMAVEYGTRNTNQIFGFGCSDYEYPATGDSNRHNIISPFGVPTNSIRTLTWPAPTKAHMPIGSNITICQGNAHTVVKQAKITACTDGDGYTEWTFDGDAVTLVSGLVYFIGSAPCHTNFCATVPSGALNWHTGRAIWIGGNENKMNPVRYRWMENLVGNVWMFLPDISFYDLQMFVCRDMEEYEFGKITAPYYPIGATLPENTNNGNKADNPNVDPPSDRNFWITKLFHDHFINNVPFGAVYDRDIVHTQAFGAYYYLKRYVGSSTLKPFFISNGGGFDHLYRCNVLTNRAWQEDTTKAVIYGARMLYKHLH